MLTVDHFAQIRQARREGLTVRQIASQLGHSTKTVLKALANSEPIPYTLTEPRPCPVFGPFREIVEAILTADAQAPRKQRHTASQIFRRLVSEYGYAGGYDAVRRHLKSRRLESRPTFIPLDHPAGHRAEADFGHIYVDFPTGRQQVPVLLVTWSYSNCPFAIALPSERTEAILHGLVEAFTFFGCVPKELWWDNPKTVAIHLFRGRERQLHPRYAALASHYTFIPKFCLPAAATEKPKVEHRVYDLQRRWATPVPRVSHRDELNAHLRQCCLAERERTSGNHPESVGARFEQERLVALPAPARRFDACVIQAGHVDKYQTVRFDHNAYSVPRRFAFRNVTIKAYIDRVEIVAGEPLVARHERRYGKGERVLDPLHFLVALGEKPAALDHAPVYRDWSLPPAFAELRRTLEARLGPRTGVRHFIRVLQLLAHHPLARVEEALQRCRARAHLDATAIEAEAERLAGQAPPRSEPLSDLIALTVPPPDLSRFNRLLSSLIRGGFDDDRDDAPVAEVQPQATEAADHAGRA